MTAEASVRFSIIIPTYNSAKTLPRCLDSIVSQDYPIIEVCLIDGVSADDTLDIIKRYEAGYPFVHFRYLSERDAGIYDAMNKGIRLASGNWFYFLGSDDSLYHDQVLSAIAAKIKETGAGIVYGSVLMRGQNKWNLDNVVFDGEYTIEKFIDRNICHQAIFYNKTVIQRNGDFSLRYVTNADFDYNLRCYANTVFTYADLTIANFFVGGQSSHVEDHLFHRERGALLLKYFGSRIYTRSFIGARLYLQQAALSTASPLNLQGRIYCLFAYIKLKIQSMLRS
ncbi:glycosyltransferase family 2 protein [Mucilaginibacter angelicae]|uniref:Glycosyltransferase family 2 protein n=1 Tax=Mucilaginibacter angelicae TaxID=869718 RepID=A0ABV6L529_9SPHI